MMVRSPIPETDAQAVLDYMCRVGGETDFLLCDENGIQGLTLEGEKRWLQASNEDPSRAMFLGFVEGELMALFDFRPLGRSRIAHNAEVGLTVAKDFWHIGAGSIAMEILIDQARKAEGIRILTLTVRTDNVRAIALYERFGFQKAGLHRSRIRVRDQYFDEMAMDLEL